MNAVEMATCERKKTHPKSVHLFWGAVLSVLGLFVYFSWPSFTLLAKIYSNIEGYSHGFMVPLVSGYATYQLWKEKKNFQLKFSWLGVPIIALGILVTLFAYWYYVSLFKSLYGVAFILCIGLVTCVVGFYLIAGGLAALRIFSFPLIYFFFMIPLPVAITKKLVGGLRRIVSTIGEDILGTIGISVFREGNILHLPNASLGVADACSGINSLWMLMAGAALIAYLLKLRPMEAVFLCLVTLPVSVITNALRVVATAILVTYFGPEFAEGWRHEFTGWLTFVGGLAMIMGIGSLFSPDQTTKKAVKKTMPQEPIRNFSIEPKAKKLGLIFSVGLLFTMGAFGKHIIRRHYVVQAGAVESLNKEQPASANRARIPLAELPDQLGSFQKHSEIELEQVFIDKIDADEILMRYYKNDRNELVKVRIYYWKPLSEFPDSAAPPGEIKGHVPDNCYRASGFSWERAYDSEIEIPGLEGYPACGRLYEKAGTNVCVVYWYRNTRDLTPLTSRDSLARARELFHSWRQPLVTGQPQYSVVISIEFNSSYKEALKPAVEFAKELAKILPAHGIE